MRRWACARQSNLAEQWGRSELELVDGVPIPSRVPDDLFKVADKHKKTERLPLGDIVMRTPTWPTFSTTSAQVLLAEVGVLSLLSSSNNWNRVDKLWHCSVLPETVVVEHTPTKRILFCLYVEVGVGALMWPMVAESEFYLFDERRSLQWALAIDHTDWAIIPTRPVSPLHIRASRRQPPASGIGVFLRKVDDSVDLLEWHLSRGFAKLSETVLRDLLQSYGLSVDSVLESLPGAPLAMLMSLALMCHLRPDLSTQQATEYLLARRRLERPEDVSDLARYIDEYVLGSAMLFNDFQEAKEWVNQRSEKMRASTKQRAETAPTVGKFMEKHRNSRPCAAAKPKPKPKPKASSSSASSSAARQHWHPRTQAGDVSVIADFRPAPANIWADDFNGCFRVMYRGERRRSISWTVRGMPLAIQLALQAAWASHFEATGEACPHSELLEAADAAPT